MNYEQYIIIYYLHFMSYEKCHNQVLQTRAHQETAVFVAFRRTALAA